LLKAGWSALPIQSNRNEPEYGTIREIPSPQWGEGEDEGENLNMPFHSE